MLLLTKQYLSRLCLFSEETTAEIGPISSETFTIVLFYLFIYFPEIQFGFAFIREGRKAFIKSPGCTK